MSILDDEQFERYLKEFRPFPLEPLQVAKQPAAARRPFVRIAWAAACAASVVLGFLLFSHRPKLKQPTSVSSAVAPGPTNTQSLTIGRANALLAHAPSVKAAIDELSFQPQQPAAQPKRKKSALAVLSKENIKL